MTILKNMKMAKQKQSQIVDLVETFQTVIYTPRNSEKNAFLVRSKFWEENCKKNPKNEVFENNQAERSGFSESPGRETPGPKF